MSSQSPLPLTKEDYARYYDLLYSFKDYQKEVQTIQSIIEASKTSDGNTLLDVGCGTGKHIQYLQQFYQCTGIDYSADMLHIAKTNFPTIPFIEENMITMRLNQQFDIITCLFSAIGYVKTPENLQKTWETFALHLKPGGFAIVEPWFTPDQYKIGLPFMTTYEDENVKISRLFVSQAIGNISVTDMHYLVAEKNQTVKYFQDHHELGMFEIDFSLNVIRNAGFDVTFTPDGLMPGRGLYIAIKR